MRRTTSVGPTFTPVEEMCRFEQVCAKCRTDCSPVGVIVKDQESIPFCAEMPTGVVIAGKGETLESLTMKKGFFRMSNQSDDILKCYREEACRGGDNANTYCTEGYEGPYCAVCARNYAPGFRHSCRSCAGDDNAVMTGVTLAMFAAGVLLLVLMFSYLLRVVEPSSRDSGSNMKPTSCKSFMRRFVNAVPLTAIRTLVVVWQIVSQFQEVTGVRYPALYEAFVAHIDFINLNIGLFTSFACILDTDYYDELLCATLSPVVVLALLAGVYMIARRRNHNSPTAMRTVKREHLSIALLVVFLVYASVSRTIFQAFMCEQLDDGVTYLKADYSLMCTTAKHRAFEAYAALMVFVYPVGIPAIFSWWLFRNRNDLRHQSPKSHEVVEKLEPLRNLWEPYKPQVFYFEIVEYARRVALTGLSAFIYPASSAQIAIVLLIAVSFGLISEVSSPFCRQLDMWLYRAGTCIVFLSMYMALLMKVDVSNEDSHSQDVFSYVLIAAHVGLVLAIVLQSLLWLTDPKATNVIEQELPRFRFGSNRSMRRSRKKLPVESFAEI